MSELKYIKDNLKWSGTNSVWIGLTFPYAKLGDSGVAVFSHTDGIYYYLGPTNKNIMGTNRFVQASPTPALKTSEAAALDQKLDDGIPSSGTIRAVLMGWDPSSNFRNDNTLNSCLGASNQVYNMNSDDVLCRIIIRSKVD